MKNDTSSAYGSGSATNVLNTVGWTRGDRGTPAVEGIPEGFVSTFTACRGHNIHALIGGCDSGRIHTQATIVMIHGALASRRYLLPTAVLLSKHLRVLIPELPGHGASSKPPYALSVEEQSEVLFEWFSINELGAAHIFANSYGCQVAAQLTVTHPELVDRLILTGPTVDPAAPTMLEQAYRLYIDGFSEPQGSRSQLFADLHDMGIRLAFETVKRMLQDDIRPKLASINCRTLVLRGENDPIAPQPWTEEVARRISNSQFCVLAKSPHCVNYASPNSLASIVLEFLAQD